MLSAGRACRPRIAGTKPICALAWPCAGTSIQVRVAACASASLRPMPKRGVGAGETRFEQRRSRRQNDTSAGARSVVSVSPQQAVRDVHRHQPAAGQQEGQHVAEVELVVDRGEQQHHQRGARTSSRPPSARCRCCAGRAAACRCAAGADCHQPGEPASAARPTRCGQGEGAALPRFTAPVPRRSSPAPARRGRGRAGHRTRRCATVCSSTACTSSGRHSRAG